MFSRKTEYHAPQKPKRRKSAREHIGNPSFTHVNDRDNSQQRKHEPIGNERDDGNVSHSESLPLRRFGMNGI